jgi:hypothetical protein
MANIKISDINAKPAPGSHGLSRVKFGNRCWAIQKSAIVKQWVSLLKPIAEQQCNIQKHVRARTVGDSFQNFL